MRVNRKGTTRIVFLTRQWAIKIPNTAEFRLFLYGLLANMGEVRFSKTKWPELCPVVFSLPLGLMVVMPRVRVFTEGRAIDAIFSPIN